jgi:DNA-binding CsgD family transcriptional regulator
VAELAAAGLPSRGIAERLGITTRTVDNLLGRVYVKLGISGRSELVEVFARPRE